MTQFTSGSSELQLDGLPANRLRRPEHARTRGAGHPRTTRSILCLAIVTAAVGCIPPQAARVAQLEPYRQSFIFSRCPDIDALSDPECIRNIDQVFAAFLGPVTWNSIRDTYASDELLAALVTQRVTVEGSMMLAATIEQTLMRPVRWAVCPLMQLPLLGHLLGPSAPFGVSDDPKVRLEGTGQFRVLQTRDSAADKQLLAFSFEIPATTFTPGQLMDAARHPGTRCLRVKVQIIPGPVAQRVFDVDVKRHLITYSICLETPQIVASANWWTSIFWPNRWLRIRYGEPHLAGNPPDSGPVGPPPAESFGELRFRDQTAGNAMWMDLGLLTCVAAP